MRDLRTVTSALVAAVLTTLLAAPAVATPATCASIGGTVENGEICRVHASSPVYTVDMAFPADYPDEPALSDYLSRNRDGFVSVAQTSAPRDRPYQMDANAEQYRSGQPPHGTRSVVLELFQDLGGGQPSTWYQAFNYDLDRQQPITFDTLFPPGSKQLDSIFPIVQHDLELQTPLGAAIRPGAGLDPVHYQNFVITDDELIFYFAQGELLPSVAGPTRVRVPRSAIPPLAL